MNSKLDPRIIRTRRLLINSLIEIIISEGMESVNIRKIVENAEVNRSTFYLHFIDKEDILTQMQNRVLKELSDTIHNPEYDYKSAIDDYKNNTPITTVSSMFEHIQKHSSLYQALLENHDFHKEFNNLIRDEVYMFRESIWEATYMATGTVGVIEYWLEKNMKESTLNMSLWLTKITLFPLGKFE